MQNPTAMTLCRWTSERDWPGSRCSKVNGTTYSLFWNVRDTLSHKFTYKFYISLPQGNWRQSNLQE